MAAPDPVTVLTSRLKEALSRNQFLGDGRDPAMLADWMALCGDLPAATILCDLPVVLGRLSRDGRHADALRGAGLIPKVGSLPLFHQALAVRVSSFAKHLEDKARAAGQPATATAMLPSEMAQLRRDSGRLRHNLAALADAALTVERERERLSHDNTRLRDAVDSLIMVIAEGIDTFLEDRAAAAQALAALAEAAGLPDQAKALRTLPRLPFAPPPPRDPPRLRSHSRLNLALTPPSPPVHPVSRASEHMPPWPHTNA